jgi:hypothetical protein
MSRPVKPWQWTLAVIPDDGETVWIRQRPWSLPVQAVWDKDNAVFRLTVLNAEQDQATELKLAPADTLQWRVL